MTKEERWIPCSERLPRDRRAVLVTAYWHETYQVIMASYFGDGLWWCVPFNNSGEHTQRLKPKAWMPLPKPYKVEMEKKKMTIEEGITHGKEQLEIFSGKHAEFIKMAIKALEMQKKLSEYSGMDICNLVADYNYDDEENISEYVYEVDVDDFLIDEIDDEETEEGEQLE